MATQWQDRYTDLSNVNSGNELQNGDDVLAEHVNVSLENGAYAKKITDQLTTLYSNVNERVTTLELKKIYTHNITISTSNATSTSSGGDPTGWTFGGLSVEFQIISLANYNLITKQRVTSRVVSNHYFTATGFISFFDSNTGTKYLAGNIFNVKFNTSGDLLVEATLNFLSSNVVTSSIVQYISSDYTISDNYKEIS